MPITLLKPFEVMLPRLRAEEELRSFNVLAAANGLLRKDERARYLSALLAEAQVERELAKPASRGTLASMGIRVREIARG